MNHLNSVLIEGKAELCSEQDASVVFALTTLRAGKEPTVVSVRAEGWLAESVREALASPRVLRVVGHLEGAPLFLVAEHVEYKPR